MNLIEGCDRQQRFFLPECVEDYVSEDNPVRFIDAFVDKLDMQAAGFKFPKENSQNRGRPGYHPRHLLKLYLYGYFYQIRSSRRLEAEWFPQSGGDLAFGQIDSRLQDDCRFSQRQCGGFQSGAAAV